MYHGERLNAWTHLIGAVAACTGAVWLTVQASLNGSPWKIVGVGVYGVTLTLLYSISTAYHSVRGRAKVVMRKLDHLSIYLLIAGSYTPFCLVTLRGLGLDAVRHRLGPGGTRHAPGDRHAPRRECCRW